MQKLTRLKMNSPTELKDKMRFDIMNPRTGKASTAFEHLTSIILIMLARGKMKGYAMASFNYAFRT